MLQLYINVNICLLGMGKSSDNRVTNPGTKAFESRNPGALLVALSRAESTGIYLTQTLHDTILFQLMKTEYATKSKPPKQTLDKMKYKAFRSLILLNILSTCLKILKLIHN